jgi:predicted DNA-binding helix-hairpin-helix protein
MPPPGSSAIATGSRAIFTSRSSPAPAEAAIDEAVSLASAVSLNIETPGAKHLAKLSRRKDYLRDIIGPIKRISQLTAKGERFEKVKQTTQFIVGPAGESDAEIVKYMWGLYDRLRLHRIYFSAYQKGLGAVPLAESAARAWSSGCSATPFLREHRLYQVDFLMRKYGFTDVDIPCDERGYLSLEADPKEVWASRHPEFFPVPVNHAPRMELLKSAGTGAGDRGSNPPVPPDAAGAEPRKRSDRAARDWRKPAISGLLNIFVANGVRSL